MTGRKRTRRAFLGRLGAGVVAGLAGCAAPVGSRASPPRTEADQATSPEPTVRPARNPYTEVYQEAVDAVVLVQVAGAGFSSQGSGFVFDDGGHVLTNQHVVADVDAVDLRFSAGEWRSATVLGTDVYSDLAVLGVDGRPDYATQLPFVESPPAIGTEVVAIGTPFGLEKSLSTGIVSGVNRSIPTRGGFTIPDAVQTDAAVNPGNSGGPLVTLEGQSVGVIRSGGGDNIGFAVSAALVERVAPALIARGRYRHPFIGIGLIDVTPTVAEALNLETVTGVLVTQVQEGGPADGVLRGSDETREVNGLEVPIGGDVILRIDGEPIPAASALGRYLALETQPGQTVPVRVLRGGDETTIELTLGARPPPGEF